MNNRDFDNLFNNKLDGINEDDFDFNDAAWQGVKGTLEEDNILPPQRRWRKFLPLLLITGFLISNVLLSWKYYSAGKEVSLLEQQMEALQSQLFQYQKQLSAVNEGMEAANTSVLKEEKKEPLANESIPISNSSIKIVERIVERIIYVPQIVYVNQGDDNLPNLPLSNGSFSDDSRLILKNSIFNQPSLGKLPSNYGDTSSADFYLSDKWIKSLDFIMIEGAEDLGISNSDNGFVLDNSLDNSLGLDSLEFLKKITAAAAAAETVQIEPLFLDKKVIKPLEYDLDSLAELESNVEVKRHKNSLADYLFVIREGLSPDGYELGLTVDGNLGYLPDYFNNSRIGGGLVGGFRFSDNIRLSVGAVWMNSIYKLDNIQDGNYSDETFASLPELKPFYVDDQLKKAEGRLQFIEIPLEAEYVFFKNKKWRPFVGAGVVARYHYKQTFEYYFLQAPNYLAEYNTGYKEGNFKEFGLDTWTAKAGIEYSINRHWLTKGSLNYANDFNANGFDSRTFQQFGIGLSLMYCF
jgi:hypothetical protein